MAESTQIRKKVMQNQKKIIQNTSTPKTPGRRYDQAVKYILENAELSDAQRAGIVSLQVANSLTPRVKLVSATALVLAGPRLDPGQLNAATVAHVAGQWLYRSQQGGLSGLQHGGAL